MFHSRILRALHYDAVVIGGGRTGCLCASQLASMGRTVLILESGPDISKKKAWAADAPAAKYLHRLLGSGLEAHNNWTTPQEGYAGGSKKPLLIPHAQCLGGSGVIGQRTWLLSPHSDWTKMPWSYPNFLNARRRWEAVDTSNPQRGTVGRVGIMRPGASAPCYKAFSEALMSLRVPFTTDFNQQSGILHHCAGRIEVAVEETTLKSASSYHMLLQLLQLKIPLGLRCNTTALRLDGGSDGIPKAVLCCDNKTGEESVFEADNFILAANPVNNAQLLLRSEGSLRALVPQSVGCNFFSCPSVVLQYRCHTKDTHHCFLSKITQMFALIGWQSLQRNALCTGFDDMVCLWSPEGSADEPQARITIQPFAMNNVGEIPAAVDHCIQLTVELIRPQSRGVVTADAVDPRYYSNAADRETMNAAVKFALSIAKQPSMLPITGWEEPLAILDEATTREGGTLATGDVVNAHSFSVHGIDNLFCCDASVFPSPLLGDFTPIVYALGELFLDTILASQKVEQMADQSGESKKKSSANFPEDDKQNEDVKVTYY